MGKSKTRQFILIALILLCVRSARAFIVDESTNVVLDATDNTDVFLNLFHPSLGNLQSVKITVTGQLVGGWQYENLNAKPSAKFAANYELDQVLDITDGAQSYLAMSKTTVTNGMAIPVMPKYDGVTDGAGTSGASIQSVNTTQSPVFVYNTAPTLAPFIGLGQTDFTVASVENDNITASGKPAKFWLDNYSEGNATIDIQYTYSANVAAVPEPSTTALLGFGMLAIGFAIRRRASQSK